MKLVTVTGISKKEERGFELKDISFSQERFQKIAIAGETGSGKSTLLKVIAGLVQPDAGQVLFEQERVKGPAEKLVAGHAGIAYLSQHFELPGFLRVEQVLRYANTLSTAEASLIYEVCRITHLLERKTDQLSGGEKQRIAFARLLISSPGLLLLDEPFSNLDPLHKATLKAVIHDIGEKLKISCIMVSHDPLDSLSWADEILVLRNGQLVQKGTPEQIYRQPQNEYIAGLFGKYLLLSPSQADLFLVATGSKQNGKSLLLRPEHLKLVAEEAGALRGKIEKLHFYGSFYEAEVSLSRATVIVKTEEANFTKGDTVYVRLSAENMWLI